MNFDYNEEQQLLADSVRRFIQKDYDFESRKKIVDSPEGASERVWATLAEMGLMGIPFSTDHGGFGGGAVDLLSVMEAFGEGLVVEPYLATLMGAQCVARAGSDAQKKAILPAVVEGKLKMAFAFSEKGARYELAPAAVKAQKAGAGWTLAGEKVVVVGAPAAGRIAVTALAPGGPSLFLVEARAAKLKPYRTLDEMIQQLFGVVYAQQAVVGIVAAIGVVTALLISVLQRRRELGLLRAVGASRAQVLRSVLAEAVLMGLIGAACGLVIGIPMEYYAVRVILLEEAGFNFDVAVPWAIVGAVVGAALLIAALAGLLPALHAVRIRIADAVAYE